MSQDRTQDRLAQHAADSLRNLIGIAGRLSAALDEDGERCPVGLLARLVLDVDHAARQLADHQDRLSPALDPAQRAIK